MEQQIDLSKYKNALTRKHQIIRMAWTVVWAIFARPLPRSIGSGWKRFLLRLFGAKLASISHSIFFCESILSGKSGNG